MSDELPITDELLDRILNADIQRIAAKSSRGEPLTIGERKLIEEERTRRAKKSFPVFTLEGEGAPSRFEGMTQAELAEEWGYSLRQIKNWIADGKEKKDPAPLIHPAEMPAWFARVYAPRECPERLKLAARRLLDDGAATSSSVETEAQPEPVPKIEISDSEKGLLAMLERLRSAEATLHARYMAAIESGSVRADFLLSEWKKISAELRALEKAAPKALEELGVYVRKDEVRRELTALHASIIKAFRHGLRDARTRLRRTEDVGGWNLEVDNLVDQVAAMLCDTKFAEPLELEAA
jgi:hypothetical protein